MQFQVPQFIEIEDKLVGPLSFKQFVYVLGGIGGAFALWRILPHIIAPIFIVPVLVLALALAFYQVHGRPFIYVLESALRFSMKGKLYLWKKEEKKRGDLGHATEVAHDKAPLPKLTESKLSEIAWSLDIKEKIR
ncbi:MAG: hypothetical protein COV07_00855 [Candidatus Vogelbacteria bacterium CG10_big_fil_rev_8_21_14_0_10_45_14]|uniref:PrgI family protein n=1 Tax=Candidatus Vogelbacteria bacterium CG10_big_fil_rev_8_21_14_0_10_45_14 TaxID=1975042 RepID=A0A2H0RKV6_9BACT|nr:MAG: hypothetical protein COV07_00855 [Candidatus Vogelbacteria bacterium CG10_big_fil_rev_8_21_14_0_10_45_14]